MRGFLARDAKPVVLTRDKIDGIHLQGERQLHSCVHTQRAAATATTGCCWCSGAAQLAAHECSICSRLDTHIDTHACHVSPVMQAAQSWAPASSTAFAAAATATTTSTATPAAASQSRRAPAARPPMRSRAAVAAAATGPAATMRAATAPSLQHTRTDWRLCWTSECCCAVVCCSTDPQLAPAPQSPAPQSP